MALTKQKKTEIVEGLKKVVKDNETVAFVNFHGLGVAHTTDMRKALSEEEVGYTVAKKSLVRLALKESSATGEVPSLDGELAIAYGKETSPARGVYEFGKAHSSAEGTPLKLLGGIFGGRYVDAVEMEEIAQIPSLQVLRGMFVNIINSPIQRCAIALSQIAEKKS